jgi:hypothetical protein
MAGRILNRRELRKQADEAEAQQERSPADEDDELDEPREADDEKPPGDSPDEADGAKPALAKKPARARKTRKPKAPPRMRARWGVFDSSMKQVAIYDYNQRAAADEKVAQLAAARKTGTFFLQIVKEVMPDADAEGTPDPRA